MPQFLTSAAQGAKDMINARGRPPVHIAEGIALALGGVLLTGALAAATAPTKANPTARAQDRRLDKPDFAPKTKDMGAIWAPLFLVLGLSGLRVWNAPASPERTRALGLWGLLQGLHATWAVLGPTRQTAQTVVAASTLMTGLGYLYEVRKVDTTSAALVSPYVGWTSLAGLITGEIWRRNKDKPTVH